MNYQVKTINNMDVKILQYKNRHSVYSLHIPFAMEPFFMIFCELHRGHCMIA
jgi:hypothetical protein